MTTQKWPRGTSAAAGLVAACLAVAAAVVVGAGPARAQAGGERLTTYDVGIVIEGNGSILVRETIDYDFGTTARHGIFREIPVRVRHDGKYDRLYPLEVVSVEVSPDSAPYEVEDEGAVKRIRMGDPDRTVTGAHRYAITYRVAAAVNGFAGHDELYWNVIGTDWPVPIGDARVRVEAPAEVQQVACFAGPDGSSLPCGKANKGDRLATFSQSPLDPGAGLTIVVGFAKGAVAGPAPLLEERWTLSRAFELTPFTVATSGLLLAAVVGLVAWLVWRTGRDRRWVGGPVDVVFGPGPDGGGEEQSVGLRERPLTPVEFVPPGDLRPGQVGTLIDEQANPLDVTATIVDLAVRGHLRITEIPKQGWFGKPDWQLVLLDADDPRLLPYEEALLDGIFPGVNEMKLSELRNVFASRLRKVQDALYDDAVARGWFRTRPDRTRNLWRVIGIAATLVGAGLVVAAAWFTRLGLLPIPLVVGGLLLCAVSGRMPRRTAKGTGVLRQVQGFRRFIRESEAERARFAERKHLFSEYLPYAIVFGCTERWARTFAGLDGELPGTGWYVGSGVYSPAGFAHSIDGFTVNTAGTIASSPAGSSGFSGGSSGGGGGGGGGGSW